jgi:hypothetical protein
LDRGTLILLEKQLLSLIFFVLVNLEHWNGTYFEDITLKSLGLRIQLGHRSGESCLNPCPAFADGFIIIDVNGIHDIGLDFCDCEYAKAHHIQILQFRWFPATVTNPKSAATRRVLKHFQILSFESKVSGFEFYYSLARETDNTGIIATKVCIPYYFGCLTDCIFSLGSLPILYANGS